MVEYLDEIHHSIEHLQCIVKEINEKDLDSERATARLKVFPSIDGSNMFQVVLFEPTPLIPKSKRHLSCLLTTMDIVFLVVKNMLQANT